MTKKTEDEYTKRAGRKLLGLGISLTVLGLYELFSTVITFKSSLTQVKGTIRSADTYITTVTDDRGHNSQISELIFYLIGHKQKYYLIKNIGDSYADENHTKILQGLKRTDSVTVWILKTETQQYQPKVFQIDNDTETLLDFESVRTENGFLTMFYFIAGLGSIGFVFYRRDPEKFMKIFWV